VAPDCLKNCSSATAAVSPQRLGTMMISLGKCNPSETSIDPDRPGLVTPCFVPLFNLYSLSKPSPYGGTPRNSIFEKRKQSGSSRQLKYLGCVLVTPDFGLESGG
jgi:hypothetical protein